MQNRSFNLNAIPPVVKNLLIINILLFFATYVLQTIGIDLDKYLALYYFKSEYFRPYQFITHMFMHGGFFHIFMNMFMLWMFGRVLESVWGAKRFLIFYFVTGLGAAAFYTFVNWISISSMVDAANAFMNTPTPDDFIKFVNHYLPEYKTHVIDFTNSWAAHNGNDSSFVQEASNFINAKIRETMNIPTIGASGAIYGVLLAFGMLFPNTVLMLIFPPIPIKAKYMVMILGGIELYLSFTQPGDHIAHAAHLGGMIFAFLLIKYWKKNSINFY
ncbi:MAG: rhomboid family intramembrane serine protease [Chlorobi bacterium]|nr:rhomboid family intramembrane serine protease [Chlorobiota bacterium]